MENIYLPKIAVIKDIFEETYDTKTFRLSLKNQEEQAKFTFKSGQFLEVGVIGVGEAPIGLSSNPNEKEFFEITVRRVGSVTNALHKLSPGDEMSVRGPYGNGFPFNEVKGKNILIVGGGIGLPPLRSLFEPMFDARKEFKDILILYGARTPADLVYKEKLKKWESMKDLRMLISVDVGDKNWKGNVGVVTTLFPKTKIHIENAVSFVCGPPIMIKFVILELLKMGFAEENIISTLERYMKCGVGKCGHCAIGHKYICVDGPVFSYKQIKSFPEKE